jgi:amino acid transporter
VAVSAVRAAGVDRGAAFLAAGGLSSRFGRAGRLCLRLRAARRVQVGWIYYVARATALAANSNVFVTYAATLWAPLGEGAARAIAIVALVGALTAINIVGVKRAIRALDAVTLLKAAPLVVMAVYALVAVAPALPAPGPPPPLSELEAAALLIFYAFVGFENSVVPAGETADPRRTIPRALITTLLSTVALYFLVQLAFASVMPRDAGGDAPLVEFGRVVAGRREHCC